MTGSSDPERAAAKRAGEHAKPLGERRRDGAESEDIKDALARERNLLRTLIDNLPDYIYAKDTESRFVLNNEAHVHELRAERPEEVLGKTDYDIFPKELADQYFADEQAVLKSGKPLLNREEAGVDERGNPQWLLTTKVPLRNDAGEIVGIVGISRDVTAQKAAEEELRRRLTELEVLERKHNEAEEALRRRVEFQHLVTGISSDFIDAPSSEIDRLIEHALSVIGGFSKADRSYLLLFRERGKVLDNLHEWRAEGIKSQVGSRRNIVVDKKLPWFTQAAPDLEVVAVPDVAALPPEAKAEKEFFQEQGVRSLILVPMSSAGALIGYLGLDSVRAARSWGENTTALLKIVGEIFVNALSRKMHQEALDRERTLMDALMNNIPDAVYFKDVESRFIRISKAQGERYGLEGPGQAVGKTDLAFFSEEHAKQTYTDEQRIINTGQPLVGKVEKLTRPNQPNRWVSTTKMPLRNAHNEIIGTFGISRDITRRVQAEEALEEHAALLEQANVELKARNQELDEFTYVASHDLQEPLRKLIAFSDVLREDLREGNQVEVQHDLEVLSSAAHRMQTLVQDLLSLSRSGRQSMKIEELALDDVLDEVLDTLEIQIEESGVVITRAPLPRVEGDRTLLAQLFQNLIGNALKFRGEAPPRIELTAEKAEAGHNLLGVRDNGIGLKPEYSEQIFSLFKRLHGRGEYEGTGIGLAICRKIVDRHGGRIWVESEPGQGAYFRFTLGQPRKGQT